MASGMFYQLPIGITAHSFVAISGSSALAALPDHQVPARSPEPNMAPKQKDALDLTAVNKILQRWSAAKKQEQEAHKEIEACKTQIEATMMKTGMDVIKTDSFEVNKRTQSRETVSKADLPKDIWDKYAKTSSFVVLAFKELKGGKAAASPKKASSPKAKAKSGVKKTTTKR
eukprot:TRINITY_DN6228_c0_g1_i1.p1 TRINITY_DN6228_c0_g1~~TRINITY_DN6228_c0_g1_i1.p1  ORF type:complete len:172 (+),score=47.23 TRINITY_DN6228_c0_g1_i1:75-590(+)